MLSGKRRKRDDQDTMSNCNDDQCCQPKSQLENVKSVRYDRQLRLWDDHGQAKLEKAHVCLLNATVTGCEALKSLVLPGVGRFTIVDGDLVEAEDTVDNFFLDPAKCGQAKAKIACSRLCELNSQVSGDYVLSKPEEAFCRNPDFFKQFSIVIGTQLSQRFAQDIANYLWAHSVPLVLCKCYGLLGYLKITIDEHCIFESRDEAVAADFRLDEMCNQMADLIGDHPSDEEKRRLPYLVIIGKAIKTWRRRKGTENAFPTRDEELAQIRAIVEEQEVERDKMGRTVLGEGASQALKMIDKCCRSYRVPGSVQALLSIRQQPSAEMKRRNWKFWTLFQALGEYVQNEGGGRLPVRGTLPDMLSDTEAFVALQNVYKDRANKDAKIVYHRLRQVLKRHKKDVDLITWEETQRFCKNAAFLSVIRGRPLGDDLEANCDLIRSEIEAENKLMLWYLMLKAAEKFCTEKGRYPGTGQIPLELDRNDLSVRVESLLEKLNMTKRSIRADTLHAFLTEICRYGAIELHCVAAILGGLAAQETIKLITNQYVPIDNTFLYDGTTGCGANFHF